MNSENSPKIFYGYYVAVMCFVVMFLFYGSILNTFTVFLIPIVEDLGWSRFALSAAMAVGAIGMGISAPFAGRFIDRIGAKPVMIVGAAMIGVGIMGASRVHRPLELYALYALVGCGLACATVIPCSLIISNWFVSRRGMAMGIMAMGTSVGGMAMTPVANWIIKNHGWRTAYVFTGTLILTIGLPMIAFLLKAHPSDKGLEPYRDAASQEGTSTVSWGLNAKEAFSARAFWHIAAIMFIIGVVTSGLGAHVSPCVQEFGHSPDRGAYTWTVALFVMTFAKFSFGPISDRWGPKNAMGCACILMATAIGILTFGNPYSVVMVFAVIYGFGVGAPLTVNPLLLGENLGMKHFGALFGILNLISIFGAAIGPPALGLVYDKKDTYIPALYVFVGLMVLTALISFTIKSPDRTGDSELQATPLE